MVNRWTAISTGAAQPGCIRPGRCRGLASCVEWSALRRPISSGTPVPARAAIEDRAGRPCARPYSTTRRTSGDDEQSRIRFDIHQDFAGDDFGVTQIEVEQACLNKLQHFIVRRLGAFAVLEYH